ncbi:MAG: phosphatase PAP2 family protein [Planctomycetia bacterium]|nr:phosphatase PAP2 family protein [Planctomycetia bacterium]
MVDKKNQSAEIKTSPAFTDFRGLLRRSLLALAVCVVVVVVSYLWVDRPVAFYVHDHQIEKIRIFKWLTYPPPTFQTWSPLALVLLMVRRAFGPLNRWQASLVVACLSLIVADEFRTSLGDLCGRYWPETWFNDNPSLIGNGTYGFHPFERGDDVGSFPSGHAARILSFATVWWIAMPRGRVVCILVCLPMLVSLVAMNYHFVSDCIAGSALGGIVGAYAASLANLLVGSDESLLTRK